MLITKIEEKNMIISREIYEILLHWYKNIYSRYTIPRENYSLTSYKYFIEKRFLEALKYVKNNTTAAKEVIENMNFGKVTNIRIVETVDKIRALILSKGVNSFQTRNGVSAVRVMKSKKRKVYGVITRGDSYRYEIRLEDELEGDVIKVIKWLLGWKKEGRELKINYNALKYIVERICNYTDKEKLFKIHFGEEYSEKDKLVFMQICKNLLETLTDDDNKDILIALNNENEIITNIIE